MSFLSSRLRGALILVLLVSPLLLDRAEAQGRQSGEIRGTVADQTHKGLPGVKVAITNVLTGVSQFFTTDASGVYEAPFVAPGGYTVSFAKDGFKTFVREGIVLHVQTITVNAELVLGTVTESLTVVATNPDIETETTDKNTRFTSQLIADAPTGSRNWLDLLSSLPGVNPGGGEVSSGQAVGVNGQAGYYSNFQIDGGIATLGQSSNPDALQPPLDSIEEVDIKTANFGADHGSGFSSFNVTTKSGTNTFHGTVYEYIQNDAFNALNKFAQSNTPLRWNEYGFNLGGPIKKNRAFFFFSYQRNPSSVSFPAPTSFPTTAYRNGDFSALLGGPSVDGNGNPVINPCNGQQVLDGQVYDPATTQVVGGQTCRLPFVGNIIPKARFDVVAQNIQLNFPAVNRPLNGNVENFSTNLSSPNVNTWYTGKVDVDLTSRNRLTGSLLLSQFNSRLTDQNCAINCGDWSGNEWQGQVTDVWTINSNLISEFRFSLAREHGIATVDNQSKGWPAKLGLKNAAGDLFPQVSIEGSLSTAIGFTPFPPAIDAETTFVPSEVVTWVKGKHILKFGGEFDRFWVNTGWGTATAGSFDFSGVFTQNPADQGLNGPPREGEGYADFLLGAPSSWGIFVNKETGGRAYNAQVFAQDEYKVKPNLTLTLGVRYILQSGWSEVQNEISTFDPTILNPATGTLGAVRYGGQGGRRALTRTIPDFFSPRLGIVWAPRKDWSIRGGFGTYNIIAGQNITGPAQAFGQGWETTGSLVDLSNPVFQLSNGPPPGATIFPTAATRTPDLLNGSDINYSIYDSPLAYTMQYHVGVQHQFPSALVLDVGYVGNRGVNLQYTRDINQVPLAKLGQGQSARPYPQFNSINGAFFDGHSNYNALQVTLKKQLSHGILFQANYTWAKALDTQTSQGQGGGGSAESRGGGFQNANDPGGNYGRAVTDIRHTFNGNVVYYLPFGEGKRFLDRRGVMNTIVGGWELSSLFHVRSGLPFTPFVSSNNSGALSGTWRPNLVGNPFRGSCPAVGLEPVAPVGQGDCFFNPAAFAVPTANTFGNLPRNVYSGPKFSVVDISLLKNFSLRKLREGAALQFKAQATDVFNHPNIGVPQLDVLAGNFGRTFRANTSRQMQLGVKISF